MTNEHQATLAMLDRIDWFVEGVGNDLMADFRELPTFNAKRHRFEVVKQLQLHSRMMLLERCDRLPPRLRTAAVRAKIASQRHIVEFAEAVHEQRETAFGGQGVEDTLRSVGWTAAPDDWGPAPYELVERSAQPFVYQFDDFDIVVSVPDLWAEGVTPADVPETYRESMREEGYLPPYTEDCDMRCDWVAFFLEGGTGATDPDKWQRVFGSVPRWSR